MGQQDKTATVAFSLRVPKDLKRDLHIEAIKNYRTLTQEVRYLIQLGIKAQKAGITLDEVQA